MLKLSYSREQFNNIRGTVIHGDGIGASVYDYQTANIENNNFEITSLRKDIQTDGRHAIVEYTNDWNQDASRRDFTINAIYADKQGNLFDPYEGVKDLENGLVNFIGSGRLPSSLILKEGFI